MPHRPAPIPVLLTAGGHWGALAAARALRAGGYEPWVLAPARDVYAARTRAAAGVLLADDEGSPERFAERTAAAARATGAAAVLPGTEAALLALAGREALFPAGTAVGTCPPDVVSLATDKQRVAELAEEVGLPGPPTAELAAGDAPPEDMPFPVVVKPLRSRVANGDRVAHAPARTAADARELGQALGALAGGRGLVQPFLAGRLRAVSGVAWHGSLVCAVHQRALRIWPPDCGISAYAETVPPDGGREERVAALLGRIGWSGVFQAQFLEAGGRAYLIDLNPRVYGSLALAVAAGANLPAVWADLLLGREPRAAGYRPGVRYRAEENDARALLRLGLRGLPGLLPRRRTVHAVGSWRDPAPLLATVRKLTPRARSAR